MKTLPALVMEAAEEGLAVEDHESWRPSWSMELSVETELRREEVER